MDPAKLSILNKIRHDIQDSMAGIDAFVTFCEESSDEQMIGHSLMFARASVTEIKEQLQNWKELVRFLESEQVKKP